jgi:hypothetical protein
MTGLASSLSAIFPGALGHRVVCLGGRGVELDLHPAADADRRDAGHPQAGQRVGDRLALRVEDLRLEHDVNDDASHGHS